MESLKRSQPEQQAALPETAGERRPDDRPGDADDFALVLEEELQRHARQCEGEGETEPTCVVGPPLPLPTAPEGQPLPRGTSVGRYLVLERLGAGGMGEVYAAFDPQLNRRVAIKLLLPGGEGLDGGEARLRLMREAQAMARLSHPNVLPVYDIGEHGDQVFIALELVEGSTLRQWLKEQPRGWREVVEALTLAGRGLAAAHAAGLVHRDFKPDNVLVGRDGRVLVFDFGLACEQGSGAPGAPTPVDLADILRAELPATSESGSLSAPSTREPRETPVTRHGHIMGTPGYMAPEQYRQQAVTARADQFSFCATLYYALYREHAFVGSGAAALARATLEGRLRPPPRDSGVPGWVRRVVLKGLHVHPQERYVSMQALLDALHDDPSARSRRQAFVAVAGAFLVAMVAGAVGEWHQRQGLCQGMAARMDGVWDAPRQDAMRHAFLATGAPYAADTWNGVKDGLDTYASQWVKGQRGACEATKLRGESSEEVLAARTTCMERRRSELKALTDVLAEADGRVVERAVEAVRGLSELAPCDTADPLAASEPPKDSQVAARVEELRTSLARARALRISGQFPAGLAVAAPWPPRRAPWATTRWRPRPCWSWASCRRASATPRPSTPSRRPCGGPTRCGWTRCAPRRWWPSPNWWPTTWRVSRTGMTGTARPAPCWCARSARAACWPDSRAPTGWCTPPRATRAPRRRRTATRSSRCGRCPRRTAPRWPWCCAGWAIRWAPRDATPRPSRCTRAPTPPSARPWAPSTRAWAARW
ncbi:protein kinase [Archangium gephyra]|nr:protein kinase [Archangium gephyra]